MSEYVTQREAVYRYEKLRDWRQARGHFWVSNGPFYLHAIYPVEKIVVIRKSDLFSDPADKWLRFVEPRIADVEVTGPRMVESGSAAEFQVRVAFKGKPYPTQDIEFVRFLVFDSRGELIEVANAEEIEGGLWRVGLTPKQTARLAAGANRLEIVVTPKVVAVPSSKTFWFVTLQDEISEKRQR
jgi:peptide/nickel transport system substrate-binding protein